MSIRSATVVVIGAGQAGLSAAFHLRRAGFVSAIDAPGAPRTYVVLDANPAPGGAWQHRWESLTVAGLNGIFNLPGLAQPDMDPDEPSRDAVPRYFAAFEQRFDLPILRPVRVEGVDFAYLSEDETSFVWSVSAPGSVEEFRMLEQRYEASPERARALADGPPVAARAIMLARRVG